MSGVLTPHNQKIKPSRKKTPLSRSPHPVGLLSPNDDQLERQKSLLSREATEELRRSFTTDLDENEVVAPVEKVPNKLVELTGAVPPPAKPVKKLSADAVLNLYTNCIKLASENKINAKNTWSLALIDHISDIVKNEKDEDNDDDVPGISQGESRVQLGL